MRLFLLLLALLVQMQITFAGMILEAEYPYSLDKQDVHTVYGKSTVPMYINLRSFDNPEVEKANIKVTLPIGFKPSENERWQVNKVGEQYIATSQWVLGEQFAQTFDLLYVQGLSIDAYGEKEVLVEAFGNNWSCSKKVAFSYAEEVNEDFIAKGIVSKNKVDKKDSWYIHAITIPVDSYGIKDEKAESGVIYIKELGLESFRNRVIGEGATNWATVFNHPATHLLLEMRNPQQDIRVLKFKAELTDKSTGVVIPGLCTASFNSDEVEQGWESANSEGNETTALISLEGKKVQNFVLPIYVDYLNVLEGDYNLRVT